MKYTSYSEEDFLMDEYFQKWVLDQDTMSANFWENWIASHPEKKETIEKAANLIRLMAYDQEKLTDNSFNTIWKNIVERRDDSSDTVSLPRFEQHRKKHLYLKVAAIFIGLICTSLSLYLIDFFEPHKIVTSETQITLELQDGTIKTLDEVSNQIISDTDGRNIVSQEGNTLKYLKKMQNNSEVVEYNQLTVPFGKKFHLVLSDGSRVYLNSGTNLRYPIKFLKDKPRDVFLDGEAFFSVEKDESRPFTVVTHEMNTQVYGTEFNVSSYRNEKNTSTVLVEGSVGVYKSNNGEGQGAITISPSHRATFKEGSIYIDKVNVNKYTAWTEGKLLFIDDSFELIIKDLERHFDVTIDNQFTLLNKKRFTGTFDDESLDQILKICQEHTPFEYSVNENQIIISPKK